MDISTLPSVNAALNATSGVLLCRRVPLRPPRGGLLDALPPRPAVVSVPRAVGGALAQAVSGLYEGRAQLVVCVRHRELGKIAHHVVGRAEEDARIGLRQHRRVIV